MQNEPFLWRGLRLFRTRSIRPPYRELYSLDNRSWSPSPREAVRRLRNQPILELGERDGVCITRYADEGGRTWMLYMADPLCFETAAAFLLRKPTRREVWLYGERARARLPNEEARSELGWRAWETKRVQCDNPAWISRQLDEAILILDLLDDTPTIPRYVYETLLISPHQNTYWYEAELRVDKWSDSSALRGAAGIHARRVPRNWRLAGWQADGHSEGPPSSGTLVHGIVERFGRFVLGTLGWRAEWVVIRELEAPTEAIAEGLRLSYPDVTVHLKGELSDEDR